MPKFTVTINANVNMVTHVEVDAKDYADAKAKALTEVRGDIAGHDWDFPDSGGPDIEESDIVGSGLVTDEAGESVEPCDECSGTRWPVEKHEAHCSLHGASNG